MAAHHSRRMPLRSTQSDRRQWADARCAKEPHGTEKSRRPLRPAPIPWSRALEALEAGKPQERTSSLRRRDPTAGPTSPGVGAVWDSGKVYFVSGAGTHKSRNLAQNPNCAVSMSLHRHRPGVRGHGGTNHGRRDAPTAGEALRRRGLAGPGSRTALHVRLQRPECRSSALGPLRRQPNTVFGVMSDAPGGATRWRFDGSR